MEAQINRSMNDQQLYDLIKKAVHERKQIPHHSQTQTFAQRYCEQQLQKKYNPYHSSTKKMGMIMKNFSKVETYFNLPQLIDSLRDIKKLALQQQKGRCLKNRPKATMAVTEASLQAELKPSMGKSINDLKSFRHVVDNQSLRQLMSNLEVENEWKSEMLKNNSSFHMGTVDSNLKKEAESNVSRESQRLFWMLQSFLKNERDITMKEQQQKANFDKPKVSSQKKKELANFLHKVSSYLQIVLEEEHKHKWQRQRSSDLTIKHPSTAQAKPRYKVKKCKKPETINKNLSNTKYIQAIKEQTRMIKQENKQSQPGKYIFNHVATEGFGMPKKQSNSGFRWKQTSETFYCTSPNLIQKQNRPNNSYIKQNFTFRRRSVKERIIKKLDQFICDIDEETHCNRKENNYYCNEINKLEHHFKRLYGRYRKETIAGDQDIQNLKKMAQEYSIMTPRRVSKVSMQQGQHGRTSGEKRQSIMR